MLKKIFYIVLAWLFVSPVTYSACAGCKVTSSCGHTIWKDARPASEGSNVLKVTIYNQTTFDFVQDASYTPTSTTGVIGPIDSSQPGVIRFTVTGEKIDDANRDAIDTSIRFIAQSNAKNTGSQFTVILKKDSSNVSSAKLSMSDYRCYYGCKVICGKWGNNCCWDCRLGSDGYSNGNTCALDCCNALDKSKGYNSDCVCDVDYDRYDHVDCNYAKKDLVTNLADNSSVIMTSGLYSIGVKLDSSGNSLGIEDPNVSYTTYAYFMCDQSSECGGNSCSQGNTDHNKPSQLLFYVKPSPIETLTITFPFNPQSPLGKLMKDIVYNNINPAYIEKLGLYYSMTPIALSTTKSEIAFSTLCNAASCLQP
ncbi:MAG: hypothetical protein LRY67_01690 [Gammaproteobacteria bacterium]|nr:hypothetical protein [Gammaproteobacteria bacterium]